MQKSTKAIANIAGLSLCALGWYAIDAIGGDTAMFAGLALLVASHLIIGYVCGVR